jgi:hypothetical protein
MWIYIAYVKNNYSLGHASLGWCLAQVVCVPCLFLLAKLFDQCIKILQNTSLRVAINFMEKERVTTYMDLLFKEKNVYENCT